MFSQKNYFFTLAIMLQTISLVFLPVLTVVPCFIQYRLLKQKYDEQILLKKRHNCVVMYTTNKGMSGWPPYKDRRLPSITDKTCLDTLYEPIIYFINTATCSLDVAYMMICIQKIYDALIEAHTRGVKIRMLLNFEHCTNNLTSVRKCIKEGLDVQFYISHNTNMESIMHYKYILKDYTNSSGYVMIGSMNLTRSAFLENYEDLVFTSDSYFAKAIHDNFEKCWRDVLSENENLLNKTTLLDVNLL